jgi:hypothetical protein
MLGICDRLKVRDLGLELEPRLNKKANLTGQAKMSIFQRSQFESKTGFESVSY